MKVIGQGHQDQGHYLKKRSEVKVLKVKVTVQGHKVKVTRSRSLLKIKVRKVKVTQVKF